MHRYVVLLTLTLILTVLSGGAASAESAPAPIRARIVFDKNQEHPAYSRVLWKVDRQRPDGSWKAVERADWRAGSGFRGRHTTHECVRDRGWLPDGRYSFVQRNDYVGSVIHGRAFSLGSKQCRDGTWRTDLFIHTESGPDNRQCANGPGDQLCRWEWPRINDYRSHGCVKMSPTDLSELTRRYHRWFRAGVRYSMRRVQVRVIP